MFLQQTIFVSSNSTTNKYYESLGYIFPRSYDNQGRLRIPTGTKIEIKIIDLLPESNLKILCKCDNPQCTSKPKKIIFQSLQRNDGKYYCHICAMKLPEVRENARQKQTGKKHTLKSILKMKINHPRLGIFGKNNPCWNPNKTDEERQHSISGINKWKKLVKERDNHTCQCCSSKENLCVHHLNNFLDFKKQRTDINNGITLCKDCHILFHKIYSIRHTTKEMFEEFLSNC